MRGRPPQPDHVYREVWALIQIIRCKPPYPSIEEVCADLSRERAALLSGAVCWSEAEWLRKYKKGATLVPKDHRLKHRPEWLRKQDNMRNIPIEEYRRRVKDQVKKRMRRFKKQFHEYIRNS